MPAQRQSNSVRSGRRGNKWGLLLLLPKTTRAGLDGAAPGQPRPFGPQKEKRGSKCSTEIKPGLHGPRGAEGPSGTRRAGAGRAVARPAPKFGSYLVSVSGYPVQNMSSQFRDRHKDESARLS